MGEKRKATYFFSASGYTVEGSGGGECLYLDVLWILNFAVDLLLLIATNRLSGHPTVALRTVLAAVLGGFYGAVCVIPGFTFLAATIWRLIFLTIMGMLAFGANKTSLRRCVLFVLLCMALGGIALGLGQGGFWTILICAMLVCLMCLFGLKGRIGSRYLPVEIRYNGKTHQFTAMLDTGNTLIDPLTGQQVLVVSSKIGWRLFGPERIDFSNPVSAIKHISGARLLPYQGVGVASGLLVAKRFCEVTIGKWHGDCLVAFSPGELGRGEVYDALTGGNLWG